LTPERARWSNRGACRPADLGRSSTDADQRGGARRGCFRKSTGHEPYGVRRWLLLPTRWCPLHVAAFPSPAKQVRCVTSSIGWCAQALPAVAPTELHAALSTARSARLPMSGCHVVNPAHVSRRFLLDVGFRVEHRAVRRRPCPDSWIGICARFRSSSSHRLPIGLDPSPADGASNPATPISLCYSKQPGHHLFGCRMLPNEGR
jgi:hypothetical protein